MNSDNQTDSVPAWAGEAGAEFRATGRGGLPSAEVRRLSRLSPVRSVMALAGNATLLAAALAIPVLWWHPVTVLFAIPVIAGGQHGLFVLAHDAVHYRLFASRWLNELVGRICGMAVGVSMCTYRVIHRLHHNHLYERLDPDLPLIAGYPRGRGYLLRRLLRDLAGLSAYKNFAYFFGAPAINTDTSAGARPLDDTSPRLRRAARIDRWWVVGAQVALGAGAVAGGFGWAWLLLWILPLVTVVQALLRVRAICEHGAVPGKGSPFVAARTNLAPPWVRWWLFPHHVNHHIEHHLYPGIPHYRLGECHRVLRAHGLLEGAEVRGWTATMARVFADPAPGAP